MIVRSLLSRTGCRAVVAPAVQSSHRNISTGMLIPGVTEEELSALNQKHIERIADEAAKPAAPGRKRRSPKSASDVRKSYKGFIRHEDQTKGIGSTLGRAYTPASLLKRPPRPHNISLELLMASQTHMGHHTSLWNPANARYIYGTRHGIHLISLEATAAHLRRAARVVEEVAYRGGLILFAGTRPGQMDIVTTAASLAGGYQLFTKWTPGSITNRDVLNTGKKIKVVDESDRELKDFAGYERNARPLLPHLVVCLNPLENYTLLYECGLANIPTIGVIDTNANPDWVTYTIPANDDSYRSIAVIAGVLGRAGEAGQARRLKDADDGVSTWQTPVEMIRYMDAQRAKYKIQREQWARENHEELEKSPGDSEALLLEMVQAQRAQSVFGEAERLESAEDLRSLLKEE